MSRAIVWRRLDTAGLEYAEMTFDPLRVEGYVVVVEGGARADAVAAWLRFPALDLVPLRQTYRRVSARSYVYEAPDSKLDRVKLSQAQVGLAPTQLGLAPRQRALAARARSISLRPSGCSW